VSFHRPATLPARDDQGSCDRCGVTDYTVATFNSCDTCGPVPLCTACRIDHIAENATATAPGEEGL
jgi:hypothetical protein